MNENIESVIRFGHCNGHTDCSFFGDNKLLTSGVDFAVRVWPILDKQIEDYENDFSIDDHTYAIVSNSDRFFIACDSNCVKSYSISDGENETIVCRFESNATHLDISSDGKLLVASAADFSLKLINLETNDQKGFEGHDAPVLSVALDPELRYIASSSCDSSVRIWNIDNQNCVHFWTNCFAKSNDFENSETLGRICWKPIDGKMIAIPKSDRIDVFQRDSWNLIHTFKHEKLTQISIVSYSFDGNYLAAASNEGIIMIWETKSSNTGPIAQHFHKERKITSLKWKPNSSEILSFCDIGGQFGVLWVNSMKELPKMAEHNQVNLSQQEMNEMFSEINDKDFAEDSDVDEVVNNPINDKDFELEKIEFNPKYTQKIEIRVRNDDSNHNLDDNKVVNEDKKEDNINDNKVVNEDKKEDNINDNKVDNEDKKEDNINDNKVDNEDNNEELFPNDLSDDKTNNSRPHSRQSTASVVKDNESVIEEQPLRQEPFQCGSTPLHLEDRFMVWNSVGSIRCTDTENENSIYVEFHDITYHHSVFLPNVNNYSIGDLSNEAMVLATNGDESAKNGKLFCMLFNIWDSTKEWQIEMPSQEFIEAVVCGSDFIAVATDMRFVRIFTTGGIQTNLFSLSGRVVCLSAWEHYLMILYHSSSGMPEEQSLSMFVLNMENEPNVRHPVPDPNPVALSPKSIVSWAGFTDEGTPCVADSDGVIRIYNRFFGNTWIPITSTKEEANGKSNNFFIIGLSEIQNEIRCIFCKGCRYPSTIPKPTLTLLPLRMPLCEINSTKGKYEEEQMRAKILAKLLTKLSDSGFEVDSNIENCNKSLISSSIKLFALALGADRESLALEISKLMPCKMAVEVAIKYADKQKRRTLIERLTQIAHQKLQQEMNQLQGEDEEEEQMSDSAHMSLDLKDLLKAKTNNDYELKPKPMKRADKTSNSGLNSDDSHQEKEEEEDINEEVNEDSNSNFVSLKPKEVQISKHSNVNPFKVTKKESFVAKTSKRLRDTSDESESESEESVPQGFQSFYSQMKQIIKDDNSDAEDEHEIKIIALRRFQGLSSEEKKGWTHKKCSSKRSRKDKRMDNCDKNLKTKQITTFFTRN